MFGTYLILLLLSITIGITLAFFSNSDFASKFLGTSGRVKIEAVGDGNKSIEDNIPNSCNLEIRLDRDYGVLIPNMPITIYANCKVYRSTTKPLLRANFAVTIIESNGNPVDADSDDEDITMDITNQIITRIEENANWYMHSDGYYYLVDTQNGANSVLTECDATEGDIIVPFLNGKSVTVPSYIDDSYSGLGIKIKIIFQAIQNFIPDDNGIRMSNTITNSLKIFNEFKTTLYESSPISWFNTSVSSDGIVSVSAKENVTYPEYLRLPEKDASGRTITKISSNLVNGNASIRNVYIPSTYTSMDNSAFAYSSLLTVDMSDSNIAVIESHAFNQSGLVSINLPKVLLEIKDYAFYGTKLRSLEIPEGCTTMGKFITFQCNSLIYFSIPSSLVNFVLDSIGYTPALTTIRVSENNTALRLVNNSMLVSSSGMLLQCARNSDVYTSITIPDDVTQINYYAFYGITVQTLTLGENLTSLDFQLPSNITTISLGSNTNFAQLTDSNGNVFITSKDYKTNYIIQIKSGATKIILPDEIESIANQFVPSSSIGNITDIHLGTSLKLVNSYEVNANLINYSGLKNVSVSSSNINVKTITGCEVISYDGKILYNYLINAQNTEYTVPSGVTTILSHALSYNSNLQKLTIPDGVTTINNILCYNMPNLKEIVLPSTINDLGCSIRYCPKLENITSYGNVGGNSFEFCPKLKTATISNCSEVGSYVFEGCTSLEWVEFTDSTPPTFISQIMFQNAKSSFVIYVPDSAVNAYKTANNLSIFASKILPVSERP